MKLVMAGWAICILGILPLSLTLSLMAGKGLQNIYILSFFVFSVFLTSFHNVFTRRQELHLWPQFGKMLLAMYVCIIGFAAHYLHHGIMYSGDIVHEPAASLYFSVVTWTTLGYGDFQPTEAVRGLAASQALLGTLFMPLLLAAFISVIKDKSGDNKKL
ncbi:potassium channel family protein [Alcanivorax sp. 1008]|uniref:potassium channel family protein n=1 Tax=Alcanivorax sp. 1008 TaxID=2816853 RepID=UPI001DE18B1F|nr:potassium channel family protein [Alcanivorax sp. 1008]MCC1498372.1 two pore domain potassium channel family protein [Alcanivorax sp. 1008]